MMRSVGVVVRTVVAGWLVLTPAFAPAAPKPTAGLKPPLPKPAAPAGAAAPTDAAAAAPSFAEVPLFDLAGTAGLPAYLKATAATYADQTGIAATGDLKTIATDFINHDFVFDVVYASMPAEQSIFHVGIGGSDGFVHSRVHGPGHGGNATFHVFLQPETSVGNTGDHAGPHLLRLQKRGAALTMSLCAAFDGKTFEPTHTKTLPDLKAAVPGLARHNSPLYVGTGNGGTIRSVRLIVDGKPVPTGVEAKPPARASWPPAEAPMTSLAGKSGLPAYLKASGAALANDTGLTAPEVHTDEGVLDDRDFTCDFVFRFGAENQRIVFVAGFGPAQRQDNGLQDSAGSRIHGPGHGGMCTLNVAGHPEGNIGKLSSSVGPHLFRIERRGNTLTMAISPDFDGKFDPVASKTLVDLKGATPALKGRKPVVFMTGAPTIDSVRLWIDAKPADAGTTAKPVAKAEPAAKPPSSSDSGGKAPAVSQPELDGTINLIPLDQSLPTFFQPEKRLKFQPAGDASGAGLVLDGGRVRTRNADFLAKNFTFDVVYRVAPESDDNLFVGVGDDKIDGDRFPGAAGAHLFAAKHDGMVKLRMGRISESVFAKAGRDAGPHLLRLQKLANTLTMAVSPNFDGKFESVATTTVPDLRGAGPFLNPKNAPLFIHGKGVIEQVRLVVEGESTELQNLVLALPAYHVAGQPLRRLAVKQADAGRVKGKSFTLESGPTGMAISPDGEVAWTPGPDQVGRHELTVRVSDGQSATPVTATIEVVSAADAAAVKGDLAQVATLYRLRLAGERYELVAGADAGSMLLLEGDQLRRLAADGFTVNETLKLPKSYERIRERPDYFVALAGGDDKCLDVLDKRTLKVVRSVPMDYRNRFDLALNPARRECYVTVEKPTGDGLRSDILIVNEKTGDVREPADFVGRWVRVSADGKALFAGYKEIYKKGNRLLINPDRIHVVPEFGNIDLILIYDVSRPEPRLLRVKDEVGGNGYGIELSADEKRISYLSGGGCPLYSYNISAWDPHDFTKRPVTYATKANGGGPDRLAFHPVLPFVASTSGTLGVLGFDRESGKFQPDRFDFRATAIPDGAKTVAAYFSVDGRNLIVQCQDEESQEMFLLKVKVRLSAPEEAQLKKRPAKSPAPVPRKRNSSAGDV